MNEGSPDSENSPPPNSENPADTQPPKPQEEKADTLKTSSLPPLPSELPPETSVESITPPRKSKSSSCLILLLVLVLIGAGLTILISRFPHLVIPTLVRQKFPESSNQCMYRKPEAREVPTISIPPGWNTIGIDGISVSTPLNLVQEVPESGLFRSSTNDHIALSLPWNPPLGEVPPPWSIFIEELEFTPTQETFFKEFYTEVYDFTVDDFISEKSATEYLTEYPKLFIKNIMSFSCTMDEPYYKFETADTTYFQRTEEGTIVITTFYTNPSTESITTFDILISSDNLTQDDIDLMISSISYNPTNNP